MILRIHPCWFFSVWLLAAGVLASVRLFAAAPEILVHPGPPQQASLTGELVEFQVTADGTPPLSYEWRSGDYVFPQSSGPTLIVSNWMETAYCVQAIVRNAYGSATSHLACLTVRSEIDIFPAAQPVAQGASVLLQSMPRTYFAFPHTSQWFHDGTAIPGATNTILAVTNFQAASAGAYTFQSSNVFGVHGRSAQLALGPASFVFAARESVGDAYFPSSFSQFTRPRLATNSTGGVYFFATRFEAAVGPRMLLASFSATGGRDWLVEHYPPDHDGCVGQAVTADSAGNAVVAGWTFRAQDISTYSNTFLTAKYGSNGQLVWEREYEHTGLDNAHDVLTDAADNVYIVGNSFDDLDNRNVAIIKYSPAGDELFALRIPDSPAQAPPPVLLHVHEGAAVLTGGNVLHRVSADGALLWSRTNVLHASGNQRGEIVFTDRSSRLAKLDAYGNTVWQRLAPASPVCLASDGSLVAGGVTEGISWTRFDANGAFDWSHLAEPPSRTYAVYEPAVVTDLTGNVFTMADLRLSFEWPHDEVMSVISKLDFRGRLVWSAGLGDHDKLKFKATDLVAGPSDDVYFTGYFGEDDNVDFVIGRVASSAEAVPQVQTPLQALAEPGDHLELGGTISGPEGMTFQWLKDARVIHGATNSSFGMDQFAPADSGLYQMVVNAGDRIVIGPSISVGVAKPVFEPTITKSVFQNATYYGGSVWLPPLERFDIQQSADLVTWHSFKEGLGSHAPVLFGVSGGTTTEPNQFFRAVSFPD
jgi:hypothetical protein